jgi:glycerol-3-phosphate dehydrogenase
MPYELRLSPGTQASIRQYVRERFKKEERTLAIQVIQSNLLTLAANPHAIKQPYWAVRPFYRFSIKLSDDVTRWVRVTFIFDQDEKGISIIDFGPQLL